MKTNTMKKSIIALTMIIVLLFMAMVPTISSATTYKVSKLYNKKVVRILDIEKLKMNKKTEYYEITIKQNANNKYYYNLQKAVNQSYKGHKKVKLNLYKQNNVVPFGDIAEIKLVHGKYIIYIGDCNYKYYEQLKKDLNKGYIDYNLKTYKNK